MTIGPDPITSTCSMSLRLGMAGLHQGDELVEQRSRVMRARGGLRVVLHRERRNLLAAQTLHRAVVGAVMTDPRLAERRVETLSRLAFESESVVLCGDGHLAGGDVDDRDVETPVSETHLVGVQPQRPTEDLVAEADAKQRQLPLQHPASE